MDLPVPFHVAQCAETLVAAVEWTNEGLFSGMRPQVDLAVILLPKAPVAVCKRAGHGSGSADFGVAPEMVLHVGFLCKGFAAVRQGAPVGPFSCMDAQVYLPAAGADKACPASFDRTAEPFLFGKAAPAVGSLPAP